VFNVKFHKQFHRLALISAMLILTLVVSGGLYAQDETPTLEPTTEAPTALPTATEVQPTVEPTTELPPTDEPTATNIPTDIPTDTPPTAESPTQEPTQDVTAAVTEAPTETPTETPTVVSTPPVFNFGSGTAFEIVVGVPLTFQFSVSDDAGEVRVTADSAASTGNVSLVTMAPVETEPPFNTLVNVTYLAAADFSGVDTFTLTAIDADGVLVSVEITVNVVPAEATVEVTEEPIPTEIPIPTREMLINYNPAATEESIQAMLQSLSAVELERIPQIGAMRVLLPETVSQPAAAMSAMRAASVISAAGVTNVELNGTLHALFTPNDSLFPTQWALGGGAGGTYVSTAWDASTRRGMGITIAVVDSGVDFQHPELSTQLLTTGWDFVNDDNNPDDDYGHGTEVAGIIAAKTNNLIGIAGIAYSAKIMPVKVLDNAGRGSVFYTAAGIVHAVDRGARIINLSLGSWCPSSTVEGAVNYALSRNVVVVAAAGNYGNSAPPPCYVGGPDGPVNAPIYPAYYPGVISVGMHDSTGTIDPMSTNNNQVDISAPGVNILSTIPVEIDLDADGYVSGLQGTSFAAPHVSGVAALLMSANIATTPATVMDALRCGAEDAGTAGYDNFYGNGRLKADFSMNWFNNSASCQVTLANDKFEAATLITRLPYRATLPVHSRSVTEQNSDPQICGGTREQTLWFSYRPTVEGFYQFSMLGSSYNTVFGVFRGSAGALAEVGCSANLQAPIPLERYVTYYIAVATNGAAVDDEVLEFRVNAVIPRNNYDYQENSPYIAYTGSWARVYQSGTSGGYTQQTYDQQATASFSFRGMSFDYVRTMGPAQGRTLIYINNAMTPIVVDNRGAVNRYNQVETIGVPGGATGQWNTVRIMRDPSGCPTCTAPAGPIDIDRIRTYDFDNTTLAGLVTSRLDDRHAYLRYYDIGTPSTWSNVTMSGAYYNTLKETSDFDDYLVFRMRGNALTIYRVTSTGYADVEVIIDDGAPILLANVTGATTIRPFTIDGLANTEHVVVIRKQSGDTGPIQLDSVQASVKSTLNAGYMYQERVAQLAYRGSWTDPNTTTRTLDDGSEVSFRFTGNDLCIGYQRPNSALQIYFDGTLFYTLPADLVTNGPASWCLDANNGQLLADTTHYARLVPSGGSFTLDYLKPQRYRTIIPARGMVQETDTSLRYSVPGDWVRLTSTTGASLGGYRPQGGYLRRTISASDTNITFYINGTGFILYTGAGPSFGCWVITVDTETPVAVHMNDLDAEFELRSGPMGYGVVGLDPGIHRVVLTADTDCSSIFGPGGDTLWVDFDAIRVFP